MGLKKSGRVGIEGEDNCRGAESARPLDQSLDDPSVAEVHPVEIADAERAATAIVGKMVQIADESHGGVFW
jgi:hypothetical protein